MKHRLFFLGLIFSIPTFAADTSCDFLKEMAAADKISIVIDQGEGDDGVGRSKFKVTEKADKQVEFTFLSSNSTTPEEDKAKFSGVFKFKEEKFSNQIVCLLHDVTPSGVKRFIALRKVRDYKGEMFFASDYDNLASDLKSDQSTVEFYF